jgi:alkylation response protein AidB-like acyl-CoA dehydrogenase
MSDYRPPIGEIEFVLEHIAGIEQMCALDDFRHVEPELAFGALREAARFFAEVVAPTNRAGDTQGSVRNADGSVTTPEEFKKAYEQYVAAGWNAVKAPVEYGGHGFPLIVGIAVLEMLTTANMAFSLCPMLTSSAILALQEHGTDEQKATYLEKLISGEWTGTMVLTEPEAGSDVGALRTKAVPNDDGSWSFTGTKIFITWGEHDMAENIVHLVLARTPGAPPGTRGISLFIVPKYLVGADGALAARNEAHCVSIEHKLGIHGSPTCVMAFEGATGYLVGEVNSGMRSMFTMMNDARLHVGLEGLGVTERAYQKALTFATERRQGQAVSAGPGEASPIIEHPDVRRMLLTMRANAEAMRALMYDTARAIDMSAHAQTEQDRSDAAALAALLTPVAKGWGTDIGVEMTSIGIQVHGGMGYVEETGAAQLFRDSRIAPIYEGTNGIQAIDLVLRKIPIDGGRVVRKYLAQMMDVAGDLDAAGLDAPAAALRDGVAALEMATEWLLEQTDPNDALAGASPYLRMFGVVAGGCYLAREAIAARQSDGIDEEFAAAKLATASFYVTQLVPQATGMLPAVTAGVAALGDTAAGARSS